MGFILSILGGFFGGVWSALGNFLSGLITRSDEQSLGQKDQALVDEQAQIGRSEADAEAVSSAVQAENASMAASLADPSKLRASGDPDSRD